MTARTLLPITFIVLLANTAPALAQGRLDPGARMLQRDLAAAQVRDDAKAWARLADEYGLEHRNGAWVARAVALVDEEVFSDGELAGLDARINSRLDGMATLSFPLERMQEIAALPGVRMLSMGPAVSLDLEHARPDTRADSVQAGLGGLPMAYDGEGVVIGVIDWGFDYTHPVFRSADMANVRIAKAWDQNKTSGPPPSGYDYGAEYVGIDELTAAGADTLYVFGPISHGTHVAGIAGGNGAGTEHVGIAPGAELLFVTYRRDPASFIDAITWIRDHAESVGKPFVVNMSFGSHQGPHDGTSLHNQAMDQMAGVGRVFVGSAGNNGTGNFHLLHSFTTPDDSMSTVVNFANPGTGYWGQGVAIWGTPGAPFGIGLRITDPANNTLLDTDFHHTVSDPSVVDTLVIAPGDTVIMRITGEAASMLNGKPNMILEVRRTGDLKVVLRATSASGDMHLWNVQRLDNRFTNWGVAFANSYPGAVGGDNFYAAGEPAGVGNSVITVGSHRAEQFNQSGQMIFGGRSSFSSRGPTVDGRMKPDISGPGQSVRSSVNSFDPTNNNPPQTVEFNGTQYPFATYSGTSMSAPAVAGVVALMLQANPTLDAEQAKMIIRETARLDALTGEIGPGGSLDWGWGKVDALAAVLASIGITSTPEIAMEPDDVVIYPNPASGQIQVAGIAVERIRAFDLRGALALEQGISAEGGQSTIHLAGLKSGTYLLELVGKDRTVYKRFIIQ